MEGHTATQGQSGLRTSFRPPRRPAVHNVAPAGWGYVHSLETAQGSHPRILRHLRSDSRSCLLASPVSATSSVGKYCGGGGLKQPLSRVRARLGLGAPRRNPASHMEGCRLKELRSHAAGHATVTRRPDTQSCGCLGWGPRSLSRGANSPERPSPHSTARALRSPPLPLCLLFWAVSSRKVGTVSPVSSAPNTGLAHCEARQTVVRSIHGCPNCLTCLQGQEAHCHPTQSVPLLNSPAGNAILNAPK